VLVDGRWYAAYRVWIALQRDHLYEEELIAVKEKKVVLRVIAGEARGRLSFRSRCR
jgi:hypothetical protein